VLQLVPTYLSGACILWSLVVDAGILIILQESFLSRLKWQSITIDNQRWLNRLLRLLQWVVELVRIGVFPYVSRFGDSFNDKDPEFPVALILKDEI
jgi:hypothetical protein